MRIIYTDYAETKIAKRKLSKARIEIVIRKPDKISDGKHGRKIAQRTFEKYALRVVLEKNGNEYKVITAYYTKPDRYR